MRISTTQIVFSRVLFVVLLFGLAQNANAVTISSQLGSTASATAPYYGQGITTASGGPWDDIRFNFDSESGAPTTNYAEGDLFLLSASYSGTPAALSSLTTGFVGQSTGISGGQWVFGSSVVLSPNTDYYLFMGDRPGAVSTTLFGEFEESPPGLFTANCDTCPYSGNTNDFDHILEGNVVPEPTTALLLGLGLAGLGARRSRRVN